MLLRKYFRKYLRRYKLDMGGALAGLTEGPRGLQLHETCTRLVRDAYSTRLRVQLYTYSYV
eukprot:31524-Pelagococcus_subviridis.AAC.19